MTDKNNKSGSEFRRLIINEIMTLIRAERDELKGPSIRSLPAFALSYIVGFICLGLYEVNSDMSIRETAFLAVFPGFVIFFTYVFTVYYTIGGLLRELESMKFTQRDNAVSE